MSELSLFFSALIPFFYGFSPIVELLSSAYAELQLDESSFKIKPQGDESQSLLLHLSLESFDLLPMYEKLSLSERLVVADVAEIVGRNMQPDDPQLTVLDGSVGIAVRKSGAFHGLDFCASELDPGLQRVDGCVEVAGLSIDGESFLSRCFFCHIRSAEYRLCTAFLFLSHDDPKSHVRGAPVGGLGTSRIDADILFGIRPASAPHDPLCAHVPPAGRSRDAHR